VRIPRERLQSWPRSPEPSSRARLETAAITKIVDSHPRDAEINIVVVPETPNANGIKTTLYVVDLNKVGFRWLVRLLPAAVDGAAAHPELVAPVSDLAVLEVVATEPEAESLRSLLPDAGIPSMQRMTDTAAGAGEGTPIFGPWAVLVRREQLPRARRVLQAQQRPAP
jgi:hypothetical protein